MVQSSYVPVTNVLAQTSEIFTRCDVHLYFTSERAAICIIEEKASTERKAASRDFQCIMIHADWFTLGGKLELTTVTPFSVSFSRCSTICSCDVRANVFLQQIFASY